MRFAPITKGPGDPGWGSVLFILALVAPAFWFDPWWIGPFTALIIGIPVFFGDDLDRWVG